MLTENIEIGFCVDRYERFEDLPLEVVNKLPFSVYIIDYNWTYLFINQAAAKIFGDQVQNLIGKCALDVFNDARFKQIFEQIQTGVTYKIPCEAAIYSPLRGKQVKIKGYALEDCYYFSTVLLPSKAELVDELRQELRKRKQNF